jgi:hypothetical protein
LSDLNNPTSFEEAKGFVDDIETKHVLWSSATHRGSIRRLKVTAFDGVLHDMGIWADATEIKSGRHEHALPYDSLEAAVRRLTEKYGAVNTVGELDTLE